MTAAGSVGWRFSRSGGCALVLAAVAAAGCRTTFNTDLPTLPDWDVEQSEIVTWHANDPTFEQDWALEGSGLAIADGRLYVAMEKYARLLVLDGDPPELDGHVVRIGVPKHAELEGAAVSTRTLMLCDEAHAAVYEVSLSAVDEVADQKTNHTIAVRTLRLRGVWVRGGKIGFEGIEFDPLRREAVLLLERARTGPESCVSTLFRLRRKDNSLLLKSAPLEVELEDCTWRLTGLVWWHGHLLGLRTQFPGERYEVVTIDLDTGAATVVLELTGLLRSLALEGWGNNVEGIAIADDGSLWLVADNAVTGVIDAERPQPTDERTLLLRIPTRNAP